jgi:hypothetical protein
MTAIEWLVYELVFEENDNSIKHNKEMIKKAKEMERNQIIRAINYCEMNREELKKQAIEERKSIGEVYYDKMIKK